METPIVTTEFYLSKVGSYKDLKAREKPIPSLQGNQVLVKIHAVSLNFRDLMIIKGLYYHALKDEVVVCADMAGEIIQVGDLVTGWKVGDRVSSNFSPDYLYGIPAPEHAYNIDGALFDGVLTQYRAFSSHSLVHIPDHLSYEEASTLPCAAVTAFSALHGPVPIKAGDVVLVQGTGGVSIFALQLAAASGAIVIATSSSEEKLEVARKLGASYGINYKTTPDWDKEVLRLTKGQGANHILEVGGASTLGRSLSCVAQGGNIHVIGSLAGQDHPHPDILLPLVFKVPNIRGIQIGPLSSFKDMLHFMKATPEATRPVISKVFSFEDSLAAFEHMESHNAVGKTVIKVSQ